MVNTDIYHFTLSNEIYLFPSLLSLIHLLVVIIRETNTVALCLHMYIPSLSIAGVKKENLIPGAPPEMPLCDPPKLSPSLCHTKEPPGPP